MGNFLGQNLLVKVFSSAKCPSSVLYSTNVYSKFEPTELIHNRISFHWKFVPATEMFEKSTVYKSDAFTQCYFKMTALGVALFFVIYHFLHCSLHNISSKDAFPQKCWSNIMLTMVYDR